MSDNNEPQKEEPGLPGFRLTKARKEALLKVFKEELAQDHQFLWELWKAMLWKLVTVGGLIGALILFLLHQSHNRIQREITNTETALTDRIHTSSIEISNLILATFESSNVTMIVRTVATDRAGHILETQVAPAVAKLTNEIAAISHRIEGQQGKIEELNQSLLKAHETESNLVLITDRANTALKLLNDNSEFATTTILADHDDRTAFDRLSKWIADPKFPWRNNAASIVAKIKADSFNKFNRAFQRVPWDVYAPAKDQATWQVEQIYQTWSVMSSGAATDYLLFVWGHTNLTKEQKLSFLRNVYFEDSRNSLKAANQAAELVAADLKAEYNPPLQFQPVEARWLEFKATNHLFDISATNSTNAFYDLFLQSDTNRVQVIRDWPTTKLILFKAQFVPLNSKIEGKFLTYRGGFVENIKFGSPSYKNIHWAYFNTTHTNLDLKVELKYEKDTTSEVVKHVELTTNAMVFDKTKAITIPLP